MQFVLAVNMMKQLLFEALIVPLKIESDSDGLYLRFQAHKNKCICAEYSNSTKKRPA